MTDIITIENPDLFIGTWDQLKEAHGIDDIITLWAWCRHEGLSFTISPMPSGDHPTIIQKELVTRWSDCDWQPENTSVLPQSSQ